MELKLLEKNISLDSKICIIYPNQGTAVETTNISGSKWPYNINTKENKKRANN